MASLISDDEFDDLVAGKGRRSAINPVEGTDPLEDDEDVADEARSIGHRMGDRREMTDRHKLVLLRDQLKDPDRDPQSTPELQREIAKLEGKVGAAPTRALPREVAAVDIGDGWASDDDPVILRRRGEKPRKKEEPAKPVPPAEEPGITRRALGDTALDVGKGVIGFGESAVGIADLASFGMAGKALEYIGFDPKRGSQILSEMYTPQRKRANDNVEAAKGFLETAGALIENPSALIGNIAESAPSMVGIVAGGRALAFKIYQQAGGGAAGAAAVKAAMPKIVAATAAGEGALGAGSIAEQARQAEREWKDYILPSLGAGAATAGISLATGRLGGTKIGQKLGLGDPEATLATAGLNEAGARAAGSRAAQALKQGVGGAVTEGVLEEMPQSAQEQAFSNVAQGKPVGEGVPEAAAQGMMAGSAMGGGIGAARGAVSGAPQAQPTAAAPGAPAAAPTPAPVPAAAAAPVPGQIDPATGEPVPPKETVSKEELIARAESQIEELAARARKEPVSGEDAEGTYVEDPAALSATEIKALNDLRAMTRTGNLDALADFFDVQLAGATPAAPPAGPVPAAAAPVAGPAAAQTAPPAGPEERDAEFEDIRDFATPKARADLKAAGLTVLDVTPTGKFSRITEEDVQRAKTGRERAQLRGRAAAAQDQSSAPLGEPDAAEFEPILSERGRDAAVTAELPDADTPTRIEVGGKQYDATRIGKKSYAKLQRFAKLFGKELVLFDNPAGSDRWDDGFVHPKSNKHIFLSSVAQGAPHMVLFGHELMHTMERDMPVVFGRLKKAIMKVARPDAVERMKEDYASIGEGATRTEAEIEKDVWDEIVSDMGGNRLQEVETWKKIFKGLENHGMVRRVATYVRDMIGNLINFAKKQKGFATDDYMKDLVAVRDAVADAAIDYIKFAQKPTKKMEAVRKVVNAQAQAQPPPEADAAPPAGPQARAPQLAVVPPAPPPVGKIEEAKPAEEAKPEPVAPKAKPNPKDGIRLPDGQLGEIHAGKLSKELKGKGQFGVRVTAGGPHLSFQLMKDKDGTLFWGEYSEFSQSGKIKSGGEFAKGQPATFKDPATARNTAAGINEFRGEDGDPAVLKALYDKIAAENAAAEVKAKEERKAKPNVGHLFEDYGVTAAWDNAEELRSILAGIEEDMDINAVPAWLPNLTLTAERVQKRIEQLDGTPISKSPEPEAKAMREIAGMDLEEFEPPEEEVTQADELAGIQLFEYDAWAKENKRPALRKATAEQLKKLPDTARLPYREKIISYAAAVSTAYGKALAAKAPQETLDALRAEHDWILAQMEKQLPKDFKSYSKHSKSPDDYDADPEYGNFDLPDEAEEPPIDAESERELQKKVAEKGWEKLPKEVTTTDDGFPAVGPPVKPEKLGIEGMVGKWKIYREINGIKKGDVVVATRGKKSRTGTVAMVAVGSGEATTDGNPLSQVAVWFDEVMNDGDLYALRDVVKSSDKEYPSKEKEAKIEAGRVADYPVKPPEEIFPAPQKMVNAAHKADKQGFLKQGKADEIIASWKAEAARLGKEEDNSNKVIFSLFDYSGQWSQPWVEAGYHVVKYDARNGDDLMQFLPTADIVRLKAQGKQIVGVLAAPPCTSFTSTGNQWWPTQHDVPVKEATMTEKYGLAANKFFDTPLDYAKTLVDITRVFVEFANPDRFHVAENPVGRMARVTGLPEHLLNFQPHHYGNAYTKNTLLWGDFNPDLPTANVNPAKEAGGKGSLAHSLGSKDEGEEGARSLTPEGFAYAFFMANRHELKAPVQKVVSKSRVKRSGIRESLSAIKESPVGERIQAEIYEKKNGILPYTSAIEVVVPINVPVKRSGIRKQVRTPFGLERNQDGTVTLYHSTSNERARQASRERALRGETPRSKRILLTTKPRTGVADVLVRVDPAMLHLDRELPDGRKTFFIPIKEGAAFDRKMTRLQLYTLNAPASKAISADRTIATIGAGITKSVAAMQSMTPAERRSYLSNAREVIKREHNVGTLLSENGKLEKTRINELGLSYNGLPVASLGLGMASAQRLNESKLNTCPQRARCEALCLGDTAGQNLLYGGEGDARSGPRLAQYLKTEALVMHPEEFTAVLYSEIKSFSDWCASPFETKVVNGKQRQSAKEIYQPGIRVNVTTDFPAKMWGAMISAFPNVQFYDYTKLLGQKSIAPNHHLTFSSNGAGQVVDGKVILGPGNNWSAMVEKLRAGYNVAMAFDSRKNIPSFLRDAASGEVFEVMDGDQYDARFLDPKRPDGIGMIVALRNKDRTGPEATATERNNGFFVHYDPALMGDTVVIPDQAQLQRVAAQTIKLMPRAMAIPEAEDAEAQPGAPPAALQRVMRSGVRRRKMPKEQLELPLATVYEGAALRPGTTPVQKAKGVAALRTLFYRDRKAGATLLGSALWKDFQERQGAELLGQSVEHPQDMAMLAQILRDPRFETLRVFYLKGNEIIGSTGITSRLPGIVAWATSERIRGPSDMQRLGQMSQQMKSLGADGYYLLHNHPSGSANPSGADRELTKKIAGNIPGFKGHVVIDHNEYGSIEADGFSEVLPLDLGENKREPEMPHPSLGMKISNPKDLVAVGKSLQAPKGFAVLVSVSNNAAAKVMAIAEMPVDQLFGDSRVERFRAIARARRFRRMSGGGRTFLIARGEAARNLQFLIKHGAVSDIVAEDDTYAGDITNQEFSNEYKTASLDTEMAVKRTVADIHALADARGITWDDDPDFMRFTKEVTGKGKLDDLNAAERSKLYDVLSAERVKRSGLRRAQVETPAFKEWFGDSQVMDEDGDPRVVYHGTADSFSTFEADRPNRKDTGWLGEGFYFTNDSEIANSYANLKAGGQENVMPVYLRIENPYMATVEEKRRIQSQEMRGDRSAAERRTAELKALGHDGIILQYSHTENGVQPAEYVVFEPTQIKSAIGNAGTFDPADADVRRSGLREKPRLSALDELPERRLPPPRSAVELLGAPRDLVSQAFYMLKEGKAEQEVMELLEDAGVKDIPSALARLKRSGIRSLRVKAAVSMANATFLPDFLHATRDLAADLMRPTEKGEFNWWHRTFGTQYHKAMQNEHFKKVFDLAQKFLDEIAMFAIRAEKMAPTIFPSFGQLALKWEVGRTLPRLKGLGLSKADNLLIGRALAEGTLVGGGNPRAGKIWTPSQLATKYGMNAEQIKAYEEARASINMSLDDTAKALMAQFARSGKASQAAIDLIVQQYQPKLEDARDALIAAMPSGAAALKAETEIKRIFGETISLKAGGYWPLMRFGKYTVEVTKRDPLDPKKKTTEFFSMHESKADRDRMERAVRADPKFQGLDIAIGEMNEEQHKLFAGISMDTMEAFVNAMPYTNAQEEAARKHYLGLALNNRSALSRMIERKGVEGYTHDATRTLASFITSNSRYASRAVNGAPLIAAAANIPKGQGNVATEATLLREYVMNPKEGAAKFRGFLFAQFLGGSIAAGLVNLTQPALMTLPYLSQFGMGRASRAMTAAMKDTYDWTFGKVADKALEDALKRAAEQGIIEPQEIFQLMAAARSGTSSFLSAKFMRVWGAFFSVTEVFNRTVTFSAAFRIGKQMANVDPYAFAVKAVADSQGLYNKANRPNLARETGAAGTVGTIAFTFKQYSIAYVEFLKRLYGDGLLPKPAFLLALGLLWLAAGAEGEPGSEDFDDLMETLWGWMGRPLNMKKEKRKFLRETLGLNRGTSDFVLQGVSSVMPLDVQGRLGMQNLIPGSAMFNPSRQDEVGGEALEVLGVTGGFAKTVGESFGKLRKGEVGGALKTIAPKAVRDVVQGIEMWQTGKMKDKGDRVTMPASKTDALVRTLGFNPAANAEEQERIGILHTDKAIVKAKKQEWHDRLAKALAEGDDKARAAVIAERNEWMRQFSDYPITINWASVSQKAQQMRRTRAERFIRTAPREIRQEARELLLNQD